jgi:DNA-binding beta-propeller fold protein YncE
MCSRADKAATVPLRSVPRLRVPQVLRPGETSDPTTEVVGHPPGKKAVRHSPVRSRVRLLAACMLLGCVVCGCATPQGELFEPINPPVVWPSPPEQARIRLVGSIGGSDDLSAGRSGGEAFRAALRGPRPPIRFSSPHSVAIERGRLLAVTDVGLGGVHIIDLEARTHTLVSGFEDQRFDTPIGVCWAGARLFVTDAARHEVVELDARGAFHGRFGSEKLKRPVGIAYVASRDRLYVVDGGAHCVVVFDLDGAEVARFGRHGAGEGELNYPSHICWDGGERLCVADSANFRIQLFDLDGAFVRVIGKKGDAAGDFALPKGVAFDSEDHIYVVDAQFENVQIFDVEGRLLLAFGMEGSGPGEFSLPAGLAIDHHDRIWIADSANHRIQVFDYLRNAG